MLARELCIDSYTKIIAACSQSGANSDVSYNLILCRTKQLLPTSFPFSLRDFWKEVLGLVTTFPFSPRVRGKVVNGISGLLRKSCFWQLILAVDCFLDLTGL